jgi:hypothetical protein
MAHTFDIRFARSSGFTAILAAPINSFRWRGAGSLSIDSTGLEIEPKLGLRSLLARRVRLRINAVDLREVSRMGDDLRIEFGIPGSRRATVPFWVRDRQTADEIMRLMPTRRTIELDESLPGDARRFRADAPVVASLLVVLGALALGVIALNQYFAPGALQPLSPIPAAELVKSPPVEPVAAPPVAVAAPVEPPAAPSDLTQPFPVPVEPAYVVPDTTPSIVTAPRDVPSVKLPEVRVLRVPVTDGIVPIVPGEPAYAAARAQLDFFLQESNRLQSEYVYGRTSMTEIAAHWWELSQAIYNSPEFESPVLRAQIDAQIAVSLNWRVALSIYSDAAKTGNDKQLALARTMIERADQLTNRVGLFVY